MDDNKDGDTERYCGKHTRHFSFAYDMRRCILFDMPMTAGAGAWVQYQYVYRVCDGLWWRKTAKWKYVERNDVPSRFISSSNNNIVTFTNTFTWGRLQDLVSRIHSVFDDENLRCSTMTYSSVLTAQTHTQRLCQQYGGNSNGKNTDTRKTRQTIRSEYLTINVDEIGTTIAFSSAPCFADHWRIL